MAGPFVKRFRGIVEPLFGRPFDAADGIPEADLDAVAARCGYELPEVLQDFYAVVGRFDPILSPHNRFYSPGKLSRTEGKLVFCEENQVVVLWGYDEDQGWRTDPPVYQGINNDELQWFVEADRASDFLSGMIYRQALCGGLPEIEFRSGVSEPVRKAATAWPLVWQDEGSQLFSRGSVVFSLIDRGAEVEVQAAGLSLGELAKVWLSLGL